MSGGISVSKKSSTSSYGVFGLRQLYILLAVIYLAAGGFAAWQTIAHTRASTNAIEQIFELYNMKNEGTQSLEEFSKDHPVLSTLFGGTVKDELELPSKEESDEALYSDVPHLLKKVRLESSNAAWWSWSLLAMSLCYPVA